jgi:hypothetical protein
MVKGAGVLTHIPRDLEKQAVAATPLGRMVVAADVSGRRLLEPAKPASLLSSFLHVALLRAHFTRVLG